MEHIECFDDPDTMGKKLDLYLQEYFNTKVEIDTINEELQLPAAFSTYSSDFGSKDAIDNIFNFIGKYFDNSEYDICQVGKNLEMKFV